MGPFRFVSRHATKIIAAAAIAGLVFPALAATLRPHLGSFVVLMLIVSLLRVDFGAFMTRLRRPLRAVLAAAWITVVLPLVLLVAASLIGPPLAAPIALAIIFLFSAPPPIVSAPAFAMLMGLDGALVLAVMLAATVTMPLTAPFIASIFAAEVLPIGAFDLARRLAFMVALAFVGAALARVLLGPARIEAGKPVFDTISVLIAILFAAGAMDGVGADIIADPVFTLGALLGAFAFTFTQIALTYALFRPFVGPDAVAIAYAAGSRNAGFVVAALGVSAIDDTLWLFFALSQFPIFFLPLFLKPLGRYLLAPRPTARGPAGAPTRSPEEAL